MRSRKTKPSAFLRKSKKTRIAFVKTPEDSAEIPYFRGH
jgi:hypothetical protein